MRLTRLACLALTTSIAAWGGTTPPSTTVGAGEPPSQQPVFRVDGPLSPPRAKLHPDPGYPKEARRIRVEGTVVLHMVVDVDGIPRHIVVTQPLGYGLDEEAIKTVQRWRFEPAKLRHKPVPVQINVQVHFRP